MKTIIISSVVAATLALAFTSCEKEDNTVKSESVVFKANEKPTQPKMRTFYEDDKKCWCAEPAGNCLPDAEVIGQRPSLPPDIGSPGWLFSINGGELADNGCSTYFQENADELSLLFPQYLVDGVINSTFTVTKKGEESDRIVYYIFKDLNEEIVAVCPLSK